MVSASASSTTTGWPSSGRYAVPSASSYGSPMTWGWAVAIPLTRKAVTLSRCQVSRSSRTSTAILVSNLIGPASVTRPGAVLYVPDMAGPLERVRAWRPPVPGLSEVLHAHFTEHAYPAHVHELWTVLLVDAGGGGHTRGRAPPPGGTPP